MLSLVLPVYNEVESIETVIGEWYRVLKSNRLKFEIIICEDGSTDGTKKLLSKIQKKYALTLNQKTYRRGYGGAVIDGIRSSKYDAVLCIDSDGQCDPKDLKFFLNKFSEKKVLIGKRINRRDNVLRKLYSLCFKLLFRVLYRLPVSDPSAPFVFFNKNLVLPHISELKLMREGFWWGFAAICSKYDIRMDEIKINHRHRYSGTTKVYGLSEMPEIALRNIVGLLKIRFNAS